MLRIIASALSLAFLVSDLAWAAPADLAASHAIKPLDILLRDPSRLQIPSEFVSLKEIYKGTNGKLIIHIQDAHANFSAQKNIAGSLEKIFSDYGFSLVLSEGGAGDCSLTELKSTASPEVWKRVANSFLLKGKLRGEEYLNLVSDQPVKIIGIEDMPLYIQSVENYAALAGKREAALAYLAEIQSALDKLKRKTYPESLIRYESGHPDAERSEAEGSPHGDSSPAEERGGLRMTEMLNLADQASVDWKKFPALAVLRSLKEKEKLINFDAANLEYAALAEEIASRGGRGALSEHLNRTQGFKEDRLSQFAYFQNTLNIAHEKGIETTQFENLARYGEYLREFSQADWDGILDEGEKLEDEVYAQLLSRHSDPERSEGEESPIGDPSAPKSVAPQDDEGLIARAIDRYVGLLKTAYQIQMTTKEFHLFEANEPDFATPAYLAFINRKLAELGYLTDLIPSGSILEDSRQALRAFYDSVTERDFAFLRNIETTLNTENQKAAALISGGYHTPHLKKLLREKGYSYAILAPKVETETNQKKYEELLLTPIASSKKEIRTTQGESAKRNKFLAKEDISKALILAGKYSGDQRYERYSRDEFEELAAAARAASKIKLGIQEKPQVPVKAPVDQERSTRKLTRWEELLENQPLLRNLVYGSLGEFDESDGARAAGVGGSRIADGIPKFFGAIKRWFKNRYGEKQWEEDDWVPFDISQHDPVNEAVKRLNAAGINLDLMAHAEKNFQTSLIFLTQGYITHWKGDLQYTNLQVEGGHGGLSWDNGGGLYVVAYPNLDKHTGQQKYSVPLDDMSYIVFSASVASALQEQFRGKSYASKIISYDKLAEALESQLPTGARAAINDDKEFRILSAAQEIRNLFPGEIQFAALGEEVEGWLLGNAIKGEDDDSILVINANRVHHSPNISLVAGILSSHNVLPFIKQVMERAAQLKAYGIQTGEAMARGDAYAALGQWVPAWSQYKLAQRLGAAEASSRADEVKNRWEEELKETGLEGDLITGIGRSDAMRYFGIKMLIYGIGNAERGFTHALVRRGDVFVFLSYEPDGKLLGIQDTLTHMPGQRFPFDSYLYDGLDSVELAAAGPDELRVTAKAQGIEIEKFAYRNEKGKVETRREIDAEERMDRIVGLPVSPLESKIAREAVEALKAGDISVDTLTEAIEYYETTYKDNLRLIEKKIIPPTRLSKGPTKAKEILSNLITKKYGISRNVHSPDSFKFLRILKATHRLMTAGARAAAERQIENLLSNHVIHQRAVYGEPIYLPAPLPVVISSLKHAQTRIGSLRGKTLLDLGAGDLRVSLVADNIFEMKVMAREISPVIGAYSAKIFNEAKKINLANRIDYKEGDALPEIKKGVDVVFLYYPFMDKAPGQEAPATEFRRRFVEQLQASPDTVAAVLFSSKQVAEGYHNLDGLRKISEPIDVSVSRAAVYLCLFEGARAAENMAARLDEDSPMPVLKPGFRWVMDLFLELSSKDAARNLLDGSEAPIQQPPFITFRESEYIHPVHWRRDILSALKEMGMPLVFKPHSSALGRGIAHLEQDPETGQIKVTIFSGKGGTLEGIGAEHLASLDIRDLKINPSQDTASFLLSIEGVANLLQVLTDIYGAGMIERKMPVLTSQRVINGVEREVAYETRHFFNGSLVSGLIRRLSKKDIGREGSSKYFSNNMGRSAARKMNSRALFDPLFKKYPYLINREVEFRNYVDGLISEEFRYLSERLKAAGLDLGFNCWGHFDLMWLAPEDPGGFPVPVLIETTLRPQTGWKFWKGIFTYAQPVILIPEVNGKHVLTGPIGARAANGIRTVILDWNSALYQWNEKSVDAKKAQIIAGMWKPKQKKKDDRLPWARDFMKRTIYGTDEELFIKAAEEMGEAAKPNATAEALKSFKTWKLKSARARIVSKGDEVLARGAKEALSALKATGVKTYIRIDDPEEEKLIKRLGLDQMVEGFGTASWLQFQEGTFALIKNLGEAKAVLDALRADTATQTRADVKVLAEPTVAHKQMELDMNSTVKQFAPRANQILPVFLAAIILIETFVIGYFMSWYFRSPKTVARPPTVEAVLPVEKETLPAAASVQIEPLAAPLEIRHPQLKEIYDLRVRFEKAFDRWGAPLFGANKNDDVVTLGMNTSYWESGSQDIVQRGSDYPAFGRQQIQPNATATVFARVVSSASLVDDQVLLDGLSAAQKKYYLEVANAALQENGTGKPISSQTTRKIVALLQQSGPARDMFYDKIFLLMAFQEATIIGQKKGLPGLFLPSALDVEGQAEFHQLAWKPGKGSLNRDITSGKFLQIFLAHDSEGLAREQDVIVRHMNEADAHRILFDSVYVELRSLLNILSGPPRKNGSTAADWEAVRNRLTRAENGLKQLRGMKIPLVLSEIVPEELSRVSREVQAVWPLSKMHDAEKLIQEVENAIANRFSSRPSAQLLKDKLSTARKDIQAARKVNLRGLNGNLEARFRAIEDHALRAEKRVSDYQKSILKTPVPRSGRRGGARAALDSLTIGGTQFSVKKIPPSTYSISRGKEKAVGEFICNLESEIPELFSVSSTGQIPGISEAVFTKLIELGRGRLKVIKITTPIVIHTLEKIRATSSTPLEITYLRDGRTVVRPDEFTKYFVRKITSGFVQYEKFFEVKNLPDGNGQIVFEGSDVPEELRTRLVLVNGEPRVTGSSKDFEIFYDLDFNIDAIVQPLTAGVPIKSPSYLRRIWYAFWEWLDKRTPQMKFPRPEPLETVNDLLKQQGELIQAARESGQDLFGHGTDSGKLETAIEILMSGKLIHRKGTVQYQAVSAGPKNDRGTGLFIYDANDGDPHERDAEGSTVPLAKIKYIVFAEQFAEQMRRQFPRYADKIFSYHKLAERLRQTGARASQNDDVSPSISISFEVRGPERVESGVITASFEFYAPDLRKEGDPLPTISTSFIIPRGDAEADKKTGARTSSLADFYALSPAKMDMIASMRRKYLELSNAKPGSKAEYGGGYDLTDAGWSVEWQADGGGIDSTFEPQLDRQYRGNFHTHPGLREEWEESASEPDSLMQLQLGPEREAIIFERHSTIIYHPNPEISGYQNHGFLQVFEQMINNLMNPAFSPFLDFVNSVAEVAPLLKDIILTSVGYQATILMLEKLSPSTEIGFSSKNYEMEWKNFLNYMGFDVTIIHYGNENEIERIEELPAKPFSGREVAPLVQKRQDAFSSGELYAEAFTRYIASRRCAVSADIGENIDEKKSQGVFKVYVSEMPDVKDPLVKEFLGILLKMIWLRSLSNRLSSKEFWEASDSVWKNGLSSLAGQVESPVLQKILSQFSADSIWTRLSKEPDMQTIQKEVIQSNAFTTAMKQFKDAQSSSASRAAGFGSEGKTPEQWEKIAKEAVVRMTAHGLAQIKMTLLSVLGMLNMLEEPETAQKSTSGGLQTLRVSAEKALHALERLARSFDDEPELEYYFDSRPGHGHLVVKGLTSGYENDKVFSDNASTIVRVGDDDVASIKDLAGFREVLGEIRSTITLVREELGRWDDSDIRTTKDALLKMSARLKELSLFKRRRYRPAKLDPRQEAIAKQAAEDLSAAFLNILQKDSDLWAKIGEALAETDRLPNEPLGIQLVKAALKKKLNALKESDDFESLVSDMEEMGVSMGNVIFERDHHDEWTVDFKASGAAGARAAKKDRASAKSDGLSYRNQVFLPIVEILKDIQSSTDSWYRDLWFERLYNWAQIVEQRRHPNGSEIGGRFNHPVAAIVGHLDSDELMPVFLPEIVSFLVGFFDIYSARYYAQVVLVPLARDIRWRNERKAKHAELVLAQIAAKAPDKKELIKSVLFSEGISLEKITGARAAHRNKNKAKEISISEAGQVLIEAASRWKSENSADLKPLIIGVDGDTGAGKTTLTRQWKETLKTAGLSVHLVHFDEIYERRGMSSIRRDLRSLLFEKMAGWKQDVIILEGFELFHPENGIEKSFQTLGYRWGLKAHLSVTPIQRTGNLLDRDKKQSTLFSNETDSTTALVFKLLRLDRLLHEVSLGRQKYREIPDYDLVIRAQPSAARAASVLEKVPYRPSWLTDAVEVEIEGAAAELLDRASAIPGLEEELRSRVSKNMNHYVLNAQGNGDREANDIREHGFNWTKLNGFEGEAPGRGVWAFERKSDAVLMSEKALLQFRFDGNVISRTTTDQLVGLIEKFVGRRLSPLRKRIGPRLNHYLFDVVAANVGMDAVQVDSHVLQIKNSGAISGITVAHQGRSPLSRLLSWLAALFFLKVTANGDESDGFQFRWAGKRGELRISNESVVSRKVYEVFLEGRFLGRIEAAIGKKAGRRWAVVGTVADLDPSQPWLRGTLIHWLSSHPIEPLAHFKKYVRLDDDFQRELQFLLSGKGTAFNAESLLEKLKTAPLIGDQYPRPAGSYERFSLETHTAMVLRQFEKYFAADFESVNPNNGVSASFFRLILSLHDIGKPESRRSGKVGQHEYTKQLMEAFFQKLTFVEPGQIRIAQALIDGDPIGDYLRGGSIDSVVDKIRRMNQGTGLALSDFFDLLSVYYQCDASVYSEATHDLFDFSRPNPLNSTLFTGRHLERYRRLKEKMAGQEIAAARLAWGKTLGEALKEKLDSIAAQVFMNQVRAGEIAVVRVDLDGKKMQVIVLPKKPDVDTNQIAEGLIPGTFKTNLGERVVKAMNEKGVYRGQWEYRISYSYDALNALLVVKLELPKASEVSEWSTAASRAADKWFNRLVEIELPLERFRKNHEWIEENANEILAIGKELDRENLLDFDATAYLDALQKYVTQSLGSTDLTADKFEKMVLQFHDEMLGLTGYPAGFAGYADPNSKDTQAVQAIFRNMFSEQDEALIQQDPIRYAAEAFAEITKAQAFHNGNHRVADFVMNFILLKNGLNYFEINPNNVIPYYLLVNRHDLQRGYDMEEIADFFRSEISKSKLNGWLNGNGQPAREFIRQQIKPWVGARAAGREALTADLAAQRVLGSRLRAQELVMARGRRENSGTQYSIPEKARELSIVSPDAPVTRFAEMFAKPSDQKLNSVGDLSLEDRKVLAMVVAGNALEGREFYSFGFKNGYALIRGGEPRTLHLFREDGLTELGTVTLSEAEVSQGFRDIRSLREEKSGELQRAGIRETPEYLTEALASQMILKQMANGGPLVVANIVASDLFAQNAEAMRELIEKTRAHFRSKNILIRFVKKSSLDVDSNYSDLSDAIPAGAEPLQVLIASAGSLEDEEIEIPQGWGLFVMGQGTIPLLPAVATAAAVKRSKANSDLTLIEQNLASLVVTRDKVSAESIALLRAIPADFSARKNYYLQTFYLPMAFRPMKLDPAEFLRYAQHMERYVLTAA